MRFILAILLLTAVTGCATIGSTSIGQCKSLCQNQKVDFFKDEQMECRCQSAVVEEEDGRQ